MKNFSPETLQEALDLWRKMGDLNKDGIAMLVAAVEAGERLADRLDTILSEERDFASLDRALDDYIKAITLDAPGALVDTFDTLGVAPDPDAPTTPYDIEIVDQGFEPGTYVGWTIQFKVKDLPRLSYQKTDPVLEAFIRLERAPDNAPRLASGGSSALARVDEGSSRLAEVMMGGGQEGSVLRGFTGAAVVEVAPVVVGNAPVLPSDDVIAAACRASIEKHLAAVAEERKRLAVTENVESSVGRKMTVK